MWITFSKVWFINTDHYSAIRKRVINDDTALIVGTLDGEDIPLYGGSQSSCNTVFHNLKVLLQVEQVEEIRRLLSNDEIQKRAKAVRESAR